MKGWLLGFIVGFAFGLLLRRRLDLPGNPSHALHREQQDVIKDKHIILFVVRF